MKLKILTATLCMSVMGYSEVSLAATPSGELSHTKSCSSYCTNVQENYINAAKEFLEEAISLYQTLSEEPSTSESINLQNQIAAATVPVCVDNNFSSNTLKPYFENIIKAASELNALTQNDEYGTFIKTFNNQMEAMKARVDQWKDSKYGPCKNLSECGSCDLGLPSTPCANPTPICTEPLLPITTQISN
jgi:hypothetical protein